MAGRWEEKRGAGGGLLVPPPSFLSIAGILGTGGHVEALAVSAFVIIGMTLLAFREPADPDPLALLIGGPPAWDGGPVWCPPPFFWPVWFCSRRPDLG